MQALIDATVASVHRIAADLRPIRKKTRPDPLISLPAERLKPTFGAVQDGFFRAVYRKRARPKLVNVPLPFAPITERDFPCCIARRPIQRVMCVMSGCCLGFGEVATDLRLIDAKADAAYRLI